MGFEMSRCRPEVDEAEKLVVGMKPNVNSYNTVISGWSGSVDPRSLERMQALCDEMKHSYAAGDDGVKPNACTFDTMLSTYRDKNEKSKAHAVFKDMEEFYTCGEVELKSLVDKYSAWTKAE